MSAELQETPAPEPETPSRPVKKRGYWRLVWRQFKKSRLAIASIIFLVFLGVLAISAPFLAGDVPIYLRLDGKAYWFPNVVTYGDLVDIDFSSWTPGKNDYALRPPIPYTPVQSNLLNRLKAPSKDHLLGTDDRGRDVLSRMIWGARVSLSVGFVAVGIALVIGVFMGSIAGYYGGKVDAVVLRIIEVIMCFPSIVLILALMAFLQPSIYNVMGALGITGWTGIARLVRGQFLRLKSTDFAVAARATGLHDRRIIFRHLLPNALAPVLVSATFGVGGAILMESALSFLGFGVPPPTASWGEILNQSQDYMYRGAWWLVVYPGVAIFLTVTAFNLVGEGLRDAMDPRLRQ